MGLEGKVAVVYSGARGIGRAYCEALLQKGCKISFGDILIKEGSETAQELQGKYKDAEISFSKCDVLVDSEIKALLKKAIDTYGQVDIVVFNTGIVEEKDWVKCLEVNLVGVIKAFYTSLEHMSKQHGGKGGDFVATASILGMMPVTQGPVYCATKHGIVGFIRSWGTEQNYSMTQVRCNCICPSYADTKLVENSQFFCEEHHDLANESMKEKPLLSADEIAKSLITVLEDETANGQCVLVNQEGTSYFPFKVPAE